MLMGSLEDAIAGKQCSKCRVFKAYEEFYIDTRARNGLKSECKECFLAATNHYHNANPEKRMLCLAKHRAKKAGVPCTITAEDIVIPEYCPVLGLKLEKNKGAAYASPNSPSLDRIIPELGYVKGNIVVISYRANRIKNDGTSEELIAIADWLKSQRITFTDRGTC